MNISDWIISKLEEKIAFRKDTVQGKAARATAADALKSVLADKLEELKQSTIDSAAAKRVAQVRSKDFHGKEIPVFKGGTGGTDKAEQIATRKGAGKGVIGKRLATLYNGRTSKGVARRPKVEDSIQPSLASIIRKRIEEKRANLSENDSPKPKDSNPENSEPKPKPKPNTGNYRGRYSGRYSGRRGGRYKGRGDSQWIKPGGGYYSDADSFSETKTMNNVYDRMINMLLEARMEVLAELTHKKVVRGVRTTSRPAAERYLARLKRSGAKTHNVGSFGNVTIGGPGNLSSVNTNTKGITSVTPRPNRKTRNAVIVRDGEDK